MSQSAQALSRLGPVARTVRKSDTRTISFQVIAGLIRTADFLLLCIGGFVATAITHNAHAEAPIVFASLAGSAATVISLSREGAYRQDRMLSLVTQIRLMLKPLALGVFSVIACLYMLDQTSLPARAWPIAWLLAAAAMLCCGRMVEARLMKRAANAGRFARKVAIVGISEFSREFIERLREEPTAFRIVGLYDDRHTRVPAGQSGIEVMGAVQDLLDRSQQEPVDVIVVALPLSAVERINRILEQLAPAVADVCLTTDLAGLRYSGAQFEDLGRNPVVSVRESPLKDWRALQKTALDYSVGIVALLMMSPVLLATAIAIRLDSPGPILFRQPRMGFNNKLFLCYKFRSMHHGMADLLADKQTTRGDPRITRVGRIIRRLSIDELPQILNVLNRTMSLVGPRPHAPNTKAADRLFTEVVQKYAQRHRVKPGITGWAQVNGWRGETATVDHIEQRVACDLYYIANWSARLDLKIMALTVWREIASRTAF